MHESRDSYRSIIRYAIFLAAFAACLLFVLWKVSDALLLIFAGILFATFLDAFTDLLGRAVPWGRGVRLAIVCTTLAFIGVGALAWGGTALAMQGSELTTTLREQVDHVLTWLNQRGFSFAPDSLGASTDQGSQKGGSAPTTFRSVLPAVGALFGPAWTAISTALGVLGDALVIIFLGIFLAAQPAIYRDTLLLLAHSDATLSSVPESA